MATRKLPDVVPGTMRQWRQRKRREMKAITQALDVFSAGCVYTPIYSEFKTLRHTAWIIENKLRGDWEPHS